MAADTAAPGGPEGATERRSVHPLIRAKDRVSIAGLEALRGFVQSLPREKAVALGARIGRAYARARGPRTETARTNLAIAYPDRSASEREAVLVETYANFGRMVAETALLQRTTRGRMATATAYRHFGLTPPARAATADLFNDE